MPRPPHYRPIISEDEAVVALPRIIPRTKPTPIPLPSIFDEPSYCFKINKDWAGHFIGALLISLNQPDTWKPDETHDVEWARLQVIEWVAKLLTENDCMPCCDDLVEQLTTLVEINNTMLTNIISIVNNLTTITNNQEIEIDNSETIIEQNYEAEYNYYVDQYNQYVTNNQTVNNFNTMIYDGNPESIFSDAGENFDSTGDDRLCGAIEAYINAQIYLHSTREGTALGLAGIAAGALVGMAAALAIITAGFSVVIGAAIAAAVTLGQARWNEILSDPNAQQKVRCCMFDYLKGKPLTRANFQASVDDCGFDPNSNEGALAGVIAYDNFHFEENWTAFLSALNQSAGGNADKCDCCEAEIIAVNNCIVTPLGNCQWRIVQTNGVAGPGDPFCPGGYTYYNADFKDAQDRCIDIIAASGTAMASYEQIDCDDNPISGVGGGGGQSKFFHWTTKACPPDTTYLDITITVALVE